MRAGDDSYTPGLLMAQVMGVVGARRAAAFVVHRGANDCDTIRLFRHVSRDEEDEVTAALAADALRAFAIPCLMEGRDRAFEVPDSRGAAGGRFALVFLAKDGDAVRGVTVMVADCGSLAEAERRLAALHKVMGE